MLPASVCISPEPVSPVSHSVLARAKQHVRASRWLHGSLTPHSKGPQTSYLQCRPNAHRHPSSVHVVLGAGSQDVIRRLWARLWVPQNGRHVVSTDTTFDSR